MRFIGTMLVGLWATTANAQAIKDPEQRMLWFNLQQLATEANELSECGFTLRHSREATRDALWAAYGQKTAEYAEAVEAYVARYSSTRADYEKISSFRYGVWNVSLRVGRERVEEKRKLLTETVCLALIS